MITTTIILLLLLGVALIIAELLLIPGFTIAGIGSIISFAAAIMITFSYVGSNWAFIVLAIAIVLSAATLIVCTRRNAIKKLTLNTTIDSKVQENADNKITIGKITETTTRLAPMGNITIDGNTFEAKSISGYIEPRTKVVVVGYEDSIVIVEKI
ncbi:MAG: NfeD family protein [Rikenellaceae bacterium]